jgi:hypothetical protein
MQVKSLNIVFFYWLEANYAAEDVIQGDETAGGGILWTSS